jgi:hypothetical protein
MPEASIDIDKLSLALRSNAKPHSYRKSRPAFAIYRR